MTLLCLAVVGKYNEPLYLCDCATKTNDNDKAEEKVADEEEEDAFGFMSSSNKKEGGPSIGFQHEFMLHSVLDRLEEIVGTSSSYYSYQYHQNSSGAGVRSHHRPTSIGSQWLGFLCGVDENSVYGYATSTNIKFLAMVRPSSSTTGLGSTSSIGTSSNTNTTVQNKNVKQFFTKIHEYYIQYTLNPFTKIQGKIQSQRFDQGVQEAIQSYNAAALAAEYPVVN